MMLRYRDGRDIQHVVYWADMQGWLTYCGERIYNNEVVGVISVGIPTCVRCIGSEGKERAMPL